MKTLTEIQFLIGELAEVKNALAVIDDTRMVVRSLDKSDLNKNDDGEHDLIHVFLNGDNIKIHLLEVKRPIVYPWTNKVLKKIFPMVQTFRWIY